MARHQNYELMKANWVRKNPNATPAEYQQAIQIIARKCGI